MGDHGRTDPARLGRPPDLGGLPEEAEAAIHALLPRADHTMLTELAVPQRRRASLTASSQDR
jgi:hypothetical protein